MSNKYEANAHLPFQLTITDADGTAVDITGATITVNLQDVSGDTIVATLSTASELTIDDGPNGIFSGEFTPTHLADVVGGYYIGVKIVTAASKTLRPRLSNDEPLSVQFVTELVP